MHRSRTLIVALTIAIALGVTTAISRGQHGMPGHGSGASGQQATPGLPHHHAHGMRGGWTFTLPKGDSAKGREVFTKLECYSCHEVKGETFPGPSGGDKVGPELASMAGHHPSEFFAESIVNPSAVIDKGRGYEAPDGSSKMPSFNDSMSVQELIDLVAYLQGLKPPAGGAAADDGHKH